MAAPLSTWPWEKLGALKYLLYGPFFIQVVSQWIGGGSILESWCFHILLLSALRGLIHQLWTSYCIIPCLSLRRRIIQRGVDFQQIDREWNWDDFLILHSFVAAIGYLIFPSLHNLPLWNSKGFIIAILSHTTCSEPLYYVVHRLLHGDHFFKWYHARHHSSPVPQPFTAEHATFLEHLLLIPIIAVPVLAPSLMGNGSIGLVYGYIMGFDFLRCLGHSNAEVFSHRMFEAFPILRYLLYTSTYYNLHHTDTTSNFCLFMPIFDFLGNTLNNASWDLQRKISRNAAKHPRAPDLVFLVHAVDVSAMVHAPFLFRTFASVPYTKRWFIYPLWTFSLSLVLMGWAWAKPFIACFYEFRGKLHQTWLIPRVGFQYFLPSASKDINRLIERAILDADRSGVKVMGLAALNKLEPLNGGGALFVEKHPNLRVRVVHGNTLTAAVLLNGIPENVREVFLTGATSKLGRAIALYLSRRRVRVMMLTLSGERFRKIQAQAPVDCQKYLVQVTKYEAAKKCKTWIVGKWMTPKEQNCAPAGTHFHEFVVPPIPKSRVDCIYAGYAAMRLPEDVRGLGYCEYGLGRGTIYACHAGGLVHALEGWTHHEVGAIDVDLIDVVWKAALKHGLRPLKNYST